MILLRGYVAKKALKYGDISPMLNSFLEDFTKE